MDEEIFSGKNGMFWWVGTVEDNGDPLGIGRCRVRIFGWHTENINELPTETLPWAYPVTPITNSAIGGTGVSPIGPQIGTRVVGFFADGKSGQQPIMTGTLPGMTGTVSKRKIPYGSTPPQPILGRTIFPTVFGREEHCETGYEDGQSSVNIIPPDQSNLKISKSDWVLPFTGFVSSAYSESRGNGSHNGVDICPAGYFKQTNPGASHLNGRLRGPTGLPVFAAADGVVTHIWTADKGQRGVPTTYDKTGTGSRSFGNAIAIRHTIRGETYTTIYSHLGVNQDAGKDSPGAGISVSIGDSVRKGQQIGTVGRSHVWDSLTHLHFEIRLGDALPKSNNHINPGRIFPQLMNRHTAMLSTVNSITKYDSINNKLPFNVNDAPVIARRGPKE